MEHLAQGVSSSEWSIADLVKLFFRRKGLFAILAGVGFAFAFAKHVFAPLYISKSIIIVQKTQNSPLQAVSAKASGLSVLYEASNAFLTKYLLFLESHEFYRKVAKELWKDSKIFNEFRDELGVDKVSLRSQISLWINGEPSGRDPTEVLIEKLASIINQSVIIDQYGPDSISIKVITVTPRLSVTLVNLVADVAVSAITEGDVKELKEAKDYIRAQLEKIQNNLRDIDKRVLAFKKESNVWSLDSAYSEIPSRVKKLKQELEESSINLEQNHKMIELLKKEHAAKSNASSFSKFGTSGRIVALEKENQFVLARINAIKDILKKLNSSEFSPKNEQIVVSLTKKIELEYILFKELKQQLVEIDIQEISFRNKVRRLENATLAGVNRSSGLFPKVIITILMLYTIAGLGIYIYEVINPVIRNRRDVEEFGLIHLGNIPNFSLKRSILSRYFTGHKKATESLYLCDFKNDSPESMAFKHIRNRLITTKGQNQDLIKVVSIHSSVQRDGKTFTTLNLSACLAEMDRKTLLIDCDLRNPNLSKFFNLEDEKGLSECLGKENLLKGCIKTEVSRNLDVLPAGGYTEGITEKFTAKELSRLLSKLREQYMYIILDTPPIVAVAESSIIANESDLRVMVISSNTSRRDHIEKAIDKISYRSRRSIYYILNRTDEQREFIYVYPNKRRKVS